MIRINGDYFIEVDTYNYTPYRDTHKADKKGKPIYKLVGYYPSLDQALAGIVKNMNARDFEENTYSLQEAVEIIKQSTKVFTDLRRGDKK